MASRLSRKRMSTERSPGGSPHQHSRVSVRGEAAGLSEEASTRLKSKNFARRDKIDKTLVLPKVVVRQSRRMERAARRSRAVEARPEGIPELGDEHASTAQQQQRSSRRSARASFAGIGKAVASSLGSVLELNKAGAAPLGPFTGLWKSDRAEGLRGFLEELEVSEGYMKLAMKYGGRQVQTLFITQRGDAFKITSNNDRREMTVVFDVGEPFLSENEKGETTECSAAWEDGKDDEGRVLVVRARNATSKADPSKVVVIRRSLQSDGTLREMMSVERVVTRTYRLVKRAPSSRRA